VLAKFEMEQIGGNRALGACFVRIAYSQCLAEASKEVEMRGLRN
jgi:hypothetical protein